MIFDGIKKIWTDLSSVSSQCMRLTDRQTDGQADGQTCKIVIARPRLHSLQRGKEKLELIQCGESLGPYN